MKTIVFTILIIGAMITFILIVYKALYSHEYAPDMKAPCSGKITSVEMTYYESGALKSWRCN